MMLTFLCRGYHPTQCSDSVRNGDDAFECYAATEVQLDRVRRGYDEIVVEGVVGRVYEQRVIDQ